jgi:hypothetical protein
MADLLTGTSDDFPGVFPFGSGRASQLPDNRKSPTPTYIIEWLLPELSKTMLQVKDSLIASKTIGSLKNFVGQGVPWRRSIHWNSLRFVASLAQRWYDFPLEQYKVLQLGFKTWLALQYHQLTDNNGYVIKKQMEMLQRIGFRARKLVALNSAFVNVVTFVLSKCDEIQRRLDNFHPAILQRKEDESTLPEKIDMGSVSRK